ncbi:MAG: sialate O-acetylesterase [Chitinophagaceae bacterium]
MKRNTLRLIAVKLIAGILIGFPLLTNATVKLPALFTSNMVLQRNAPVNIWGKADAGEKVTIRFLSKTYSTVTTKTGDWKIILPALTAGGPYTLTINDITLSNVLVGDVWVCSGQSNMQFQLQNATGGKEAIAQAANANIRLFTVPRDLKFNPQSDIENASGWQECNPSTIPEFSAVAYYMGKALQEKLRVPIGLIHSSYGGTYIEDFISKPAMDTIQRLKSIYSQTAGKTEEQFIEDRKKALLSQFGNISFYTSDKVIWDTANINLPEVTDQWKTMKLPTLWERAGMEFTDGVIWFYKEITLTEQEITKDATLSLGRIADQSITYFNGQKLGSSPDSRDFLREYNVPAAWLKAGTNKVLVRVTNKARNGGIWGPASKLFFKTADKNIPLAGDWKISIQHAKLAFHPNDIPSSLFNAMIYPIKNFTCKGITWYQGESNANWANEYESLLSILIKDWRKAWQQPSLPFIIIQMPNYKTETTDPGEISQWAVVREAELNCSKNKNNGLVTTIDVGEANDIHPKNKKPVGERMALQALKVAYGQKIIADGPVYQQMKIEGNKIRLSFAAGSGLAIGNGETSLKGFAIAGNDKQFVWANAKIENNTIVVWSDAIKDPVAVRYAWADNPGAVNLFNQAGIPASPFRTDKWPVSLETIPR